MEFSGVTAGARFFGAVRGASGGHNFDTRGGSVKKICGGKAAERVFCLKKALDVGERPAEFCLSAALPVAWVRLEEEMEFAAREVGLLSCRHYERKLLKERIEALVSGLGFCCGAGSRVLLKPNLVSALRNRELACTHPEFVAAVAEWFCDQGARVAVGDSPAFGTARGVMRACGISEALRGLPVEQVNFQEPRPVRLASGLRIGVARQALECDLLVNLPRVKAHGQLYLSLAVKNYFGVVVGFRKPWLHARHGDIDNRFEALLVDLLSILPGGLTLADGVVAMHVDGPVNGLPHPLGLLAAACNPVALDTALIEVLGLAPAASPIWREASWRGLFGSDPAQLAFPLSRPDALKVGDFLAPQILRPVSFHPRRLLAGWLKRAWAGWRGEG